MLEVNQSGLDACLLEKEDCLHMKTQGQTIYPFESYYAGMDILDSNQLKSYQYISEQILQNNKVDIEGNVSYLFAFLFETTRELLDSKNYTKALANISQLQALYCEYTSLNRYCEHTIADIYLCAGDYEKYLSMTEIQIFDINMTIKLKHKFERRIQAKELLMLSKKLTKYGKDNIKDIIEMLDILLNEAYNHNQLGVIIDEVIEYEQEQNEKLRKHGIEFPLFSGNPYGYDLNKYLVNEGLKVNYVSFKDNAKFINFIKELSRKSENMLRDSQGLPKINEGWINETRLYYLIKQEFEQYKVIHQYRCEWLGLQSLEAVFNI